MKNKLTERYTRNITILSIIPVAVIIFIVFFNISNAIKNIDISKKIREDAYSLIAQYYEIGYLQEERELSILYTYSPNTNNNLENLGIAYNIEYEYLNKLGKEEVLKVYENREHILKQKFTVENILDKYSLLISKFVSTLTYKHYPNITDEELLQSIQSYKVLLQLNENYSLQQAYLLSYITNYKNRHEYIYQILALRDKKVNLVKNLKHVLPNKFKSTFEDHLNSEDLKRIENLIDKVSTYEKIDIDILDYLDDVHKVKQSLFIFNNYLVSNIDEIAVESYNKEVELLAFIFVLSVVVILFSLIFGRQVKNSILDNINENIKKINEKNEEIKGLFNQVNSLLSNANEGFLSFEKDLLIKDGCSSKSFNILYRDDLVQENIADVLFGNDENKKDVFQFGIENIFLSDDVENKKMLLSLLPNENKINDLIFSIEYKLINDDKECMVILEDVTEKRALEETIEYENKVQKMIISIATRKHEFIELRNNFQDFLENLRSFINLEDTYENNLTKTKKSLHTFKGMFAQEELVNITDAIHELEDRISTYDREHDANSDDLLQLLLGNQLILEHSLGEDLDFIAKVLGKDFLESRSMLAVDEENYQKLLVRIMDLVFKQRVDKTEIKSIAEEFLSLNQKSLKHMLSIYPKRVKNIAHRLKKDIYDFEIEGDSTIFVQSNYDSFMQSLVHLFRNIIVHGIEDPEDRVEANKDEKGKIECKFDYKDDDLIELVISDDGRGIDINNIKQIALEKSIYTEDELESMNDNDVLNIIFEKDFSTKKESDLLSGRGVGLSIIKNEVESIGGTVSVESELGKGTKFIFTLLVKNTANIVLESDEEMLSKNILDVTSQFIKNDIGVEIQETTTLPKIELMKYHSTIKLKLHNEIMSVISLEDSVLEKLLSIFAIDSIEDVTNEMLNEVLNESLNTIIGLSIHHFPDKYRKYELSTTLMVDKQILTQFDAIHTSYNYQVRTNVGNINISTIFIENK